MKTTNTRTGLTVTYLTDNCAIVTDKKSWNTTEVTVISNASKRGKHAVGILRSEDAPVHFTNKREALLYAQYLVICARGKRLSRWAKPASFEEWKDARKKLHGRG